MFTQEQEDYLKTIADKGIAEQVEIESRNADIEAEAKVSEAREAKKVELQAQADALIEQGLQDFEENIAPTIK